jgi:hypothetical protein
VTTPTARYTDEILVEWYSSVARWTAGSVGSPSLCALCIGSPFTRQLGLAAWPHDVVHPLVERLGAVSSDAGTLDTVQRVLDERHSDILDVLEHCVGDELTRYVRIEAAAAVREFERNAQRDHSPRD